MVALGGVKSGRGLGKRQNAPLNVSEGSESIKTRR